MTDLSASHRAGNESRPEFTEDERPEGGWWAAVKKAAARLSDWFAIQSLPLKAGLLAVALMLTGLGIAMRRLSGGGVGRQ